MRTLLQIKQEIISLIKDIDSEKKLKIILEFIKGIKRS